MASDLPEGGERTNSFVDTVRGERPAKGCGQVERVSREAMWIRLLTSEKLTNGPVLSERLTSPGRIYAEHWLLGGQPDKAFILERARQVEVLTPKAPGKSDRSHVVL